MRTIHRGKTTPASTAGSFTNHAHGLPRLVIADPAPLRSLDSTLPLDRLTDLPDPRPGMSEEPWGPSGRGGRKWSGTLAIEHMVTNHSGLTETAASGRVSETPDAPIELCLREGYAGRFEIVDGHHRLVTRLRRGETAVPVQIYDYTDEEPYEGPFYDFAALS